MKKSLYDISWQGLTEEQYHEYPIISHSMLGTFDREGFENISHLSDKKESPSLLYGSLVDTLLTDGEEEFNNRYVVIDYPNTPDSIIAIVKALFREFHVTHPYLTDIPDVEVIGYSNIFNYQPNWRPETRAKVIKEKGASYYRLLYMSEGKTIVSTSLYEDVIKAVEALRTSPYSKIYFQEDNPFDDIERCYQVKLRAEYKGIEFKTMHDLIVVNHKKKTIQQVDLKTSKSVVTFNDSFYKWHYCWQAQMYTEALRQNIEKDDYFKDFTIIPNYKFIVIDRKRFMPVIFNYAGIFCAVGIDYTDENGIVKEMRPWRKVMEELNFYRENPDSVLPKEMLETIAEYGEITLI